MLKMEVRGLRVLAMLSKTAQRLRDRKRVARAFSAAW